MCTVTENALYHINVLGTGTVNMESICISDAFPRAQSHHLIGSAEC